MIILYKNTVKVLLFCLFTLLTATEAQAQFWSNKQPNLLPEEQAFSVVANIENGILRVSWSIAEDYYLYRDNFKIEVITANTKIGVIEFPEGVIENDPEFGDVEVYFYSAELSAPISADSDTTLIELTLHGQGCNKPVGVCYPPMQRKVEVAYNAPTDATITSTKDSSADSQTNKLNKTFLGYILSAFGAGILLSFTPCVLPMIPILAGVIAGQNNPSKLRSGWLAICYVAGTVVTYIIAGALAGATGAQLQAYFQNIWVIGFICLLLILLAASLFGWFKIQLPSSVQSSLNNSHASSKSASFSSFGLGLVSALVVGACVSPVLILALGAAITQGDPILGAGIMGAMATGMGLLLILFGFGAGWVLPKTGAWMNQVQVVFGFMVLGVAIYLLDSLALFTALYLWAALLLVAGFYLWQISQTSSNFMLNSTLRTLSLATLVWGVMSLVGASQSGVDILKPLENLTRSSDKTIHSLPFVKTTTLAEVTDLLEQAKLTQQPVLIDFYADWCLDCRRMQRSTFRKASVAAALKNWMLIEVDVTKTSPVSEEIKRFFGVFGPPATLFINANGEEHKNLRQYGYLHEEDFLALIFQTRAFQKK